MQRERAEYFCTVLEKSTGVLSYAELDELMAAAPNLDADLRDRVSAELIKLGGKYAIGI